MCRCRRDVELGFTSESFPEGSHICYLFNDDDEKRGIIACYLDSGLAGGEKVGYFADVAEPGLLDDYLAGLGARISTAHRASQWYQGTSSEVYCPDNTFVPDRMLDRLGACYASSRAAGFVGARVTGEMTWALRNIPGSDRLLEYEARVNQILRESPVTAVCQYDTRHFGGALLFDILSVHPMMIVRGQIVHNPYYIPPEEFLNSLPSAVT